MKNYLNRVLEDQKLFTQDAVKGFKRDYTLAKSSIPDWKGIFKLIPILFVLLILYFYFIIVPLAWLLICGVAVPLYSIRCITFMEKPLELWSKFVDKYIFN